ncbi:MAG: hypothetical protein M3N13_07055 [Candidatus Eremiobacteraeota bacterium]|nr:hypothetical protein [Candidatus Eremiobacteraeota bacterium]
MTTHFLSAREAVAAALSDAGISAVEINSRTFPGETIVVITVEQSDYETALETVMPLDLSRFSALATVKKNANKPEQTKARVQSLSDQRVTRFIELVDAKSHKSKCSFLKIEFKDKETHPTEYDLLQSLMDLRLVHLLHGSLSDDHDAGNRFEVYMLDASRYLGERLKRGLRILDYAGKHIALKETGLRESILRTGNTSAKYLSILRSGPQLSLDSLSSSLALASRGQKKNRT